MRSYTPDGIRTRVTAVRGRRPRPLDDGGGEQSTLGFMLARVKRGLALLFAEFGGALRRAGGPYTCTT
jgi:hypothetical protein